MTIGEIKEKYLSEKEEALEQDYRDLVDLFQKHFPKDGIPNSDYLHALYLTDLMFQGTTRNICMFNGSGKDGWLDVLKDTLRNTIHRIKENRGLMRAVFIGKKVPQAIVDLAEEFGEETVRYTTLDSDVPLKHFITCDGSMLRMEEVHEPLTSDMQGDTIKAQVYLSNTAMTNTVDKYFDSIWGSLHKNR